MVLTIREAASITDDTYTYQDVVNMMADLIAALKGDMMVCAPGMQMTFTSRRFETFIPTFKSNCFNSLCQW